MLEIKKIFGFLLIGMSFYYLKNIMPYSVLLWLIATAAAISGIYYFYTIGTHETLFWKRTKNLLGTVCMIYAVVLYIQAYQYTFEAAPIIDTFWTTDYTTAIEANKQTHKFLFIDFWAPSCSICTAIEKIHFKDNVVRQELAHFIPVKLELVMSDPVIAGLKEKFKIMGLPAIILYDPAQDVVIKRWGAELYQKSKEEFIKELKQLM
jgi:thiol:disulfide interchange protein